MKLQEAVYLEARIYNMVCFASSTLQGKGATLSRGTATWHPAHTNDCWRLHDVHHGPEAVGCHEKYAFRHHMASTLSMNPTLKVSGLLHEENLCAILQHNVYTHDQTL